MGVDNPILSIHDVGAGGLSNALPELNTMTSGPTSIFLFIPSQKNNSLQWKSGVTKHKKDMLSHHPERFKDFQELCKRENAPFAVVGTAQKEDI